MTASDSSSYKWCDTSGDWHSGYPDDDCEYTSIQSSDSKGKWTDCTPKGDGYVDGTAGNDRIDTAYTGDPQGDKIDNSDARLSGAALQDDYVRAGAGNDTVMSGSGHDKIYGGDGNDSLNGQDGNDTIYGENGNDTLVGGAGNNALDGGNGDDTFVGGAGADTFTGGTGQDNLDYSASTSGVTVNLTTGAVSGGDAANDHIASGIDGVIGSNSADSLTGFDSQGTSASDTYTNQFWGNGGNDTIRGEAGNDQIYGGNDQDLIYGGAGDDTLAGDAGNDTVDGGTGNDLIHGDSSGAASGSPVTFTITGQSSGYVNQVFAYTIDPVTGAISNRITLTVNEDTSVGQSYTYNVAPGTVVGIGIVSPDGTFYSSGYGPRAGLNGDGFGHTKGLGVNPDGSVNIGFEDQKNLGDKDFNDVQIKVNLGTSGATFDNAHYTYTSPGMPADLGAGNDLLTGGDGNDTVYGGGAHDTIYGGNGRDSVFGGTGNDVIDTSTGVPADSRPDQGYPGLYAADTDPNNDRDFADGGDGDDTIRTGDDADTIMGGNGNDLIDAGVDNDLVDAGAGNDTVIGAEGSDTITAGAGNDVVYGGYGPGVPDAVNIPDATDALPNNGRDEIHGNDGNDTIYGMDDKDTITGDAGDDVIDGGIDDDWVSGGTGADALVGGDGNDTVLGDAGNDQITGGAGADSLSGGDDRDTFHGGTVGDAVDGNEGGNDYDTLDLSGTGPFRIVYDPANSENGTVTFLDPTTRADIGSMSFKNIENVIPCFTPGTLIATPRGEVPVESLRAGDRIITRDSGMQEIRWVGRRDMSWGDLTAAPHLKPILIRQGSLGNGLPERDMMVSPNHRVLVANDRTALYFDEHEVLVSAKHLAGGKGVHSVDAAGVSYIHFMFDRHEVVLSNGAWTESFQPGDLTLKGMGNAQRSEIYDLFPELKTEAGVENYASARRTLKRHEAMLITR